MDNKLFKSINLGVVAYYLIVYSCFRIYANTFSLPREAGAAFIIFAYSISLLTLLAGVFFLLRYGKERAACMDDNRAAASKAVELTGGSVILAILLLHVIRSLCYYPFGTLSLFFDPMGPLFSILFFMPFIVIAAVTIRKGLKANEHGPLSHITAGLWFMTTSLFVLYSCIHGLLEWFVEMAAFRQYESRPQELYWICAQFVLIIAALVLVFVPFSFKNKFINAGKPCGNNLTAQSFITVGIIILINTSTKILNFIISFIIFLVTDFAEFTRDFANIARESIAVQLLPDLIFLIIGLSAVLYGNKKGSQS